MHCLLAWKIWIDKLHLEFSETGLRETVDVEQLFSRLFNFHQDLDWFYRIINVKYIGGWLKNKFSWEWLENYIGSGFPEKEVKFFYWKENIFLSLMCDLWAEVAADDAVPSETIILG